jgi:hypothetical protein
MTEAEWGACAGPKRMLEHLRGRAGDRKWRLFACGCCRRFWQLLADDRSRNAVEVAERYADGLSTAEEMGAAKAGAEEVWRSQWVYGDTENPPAAYAAGGAATAAFPIAGHRMAESAVWAGQGCGGRRERRAQSDLFRCVFGNPFRPAAVDPSWPAWNGGAVRNLARTIYDERAFDRLPILADALEEAGCDNADVLGHCRGGGEHVRGCWVVDLLLGKG